MGKFIKGDKVYVSGFLKVYPAEILEEDTNSRILETGKHYIVKIINTGELLRVNEDSITKNTDYDPPPNPRKVR